MIQHRGPISGIAAWRDEYVATAGYDNQVICWDQRTGRAVSRSVHDHLANQCQFAPDGAHLLTSSSDYTARLWSVPDLRLVAVLGDHEDDVEMSSSIPVTDSSPPPPGTTGCGCTTSPANCCTASRGTPPTSSPSNGPAAPTS